MSERNYVKPQLVSPLLKGNFLASAKSWRLYTSLIGILLLVLTLWPLFDWAVIDAYWSGNDPTACPDKSGACWPFVRQRFSQFMYGAYPVSERWRVDIGLLLGLTLLLPILVPSVRGKKWWIIAFVGIYPIIAAILFAGGIFGLTSVETGLWGGLFLTLVVGGFSFVFAFPIGILLALGRESGSPIIRNLAGAWVELWRSVPTLVVLFVAVIMLPLFLPEKFEIDKLLRALCALSVLMSCYIAEAVRGALKAIPVGQYEATRALGMGYIHSHTTVILPQALALATPQITNVVIGLFKETSLLVIIGLFDLLGMVHAISGDPEWHMSSARATGYLFIALIYWSVCFGMSRYSAYLERRRRLV